MKQVKEITVFIENKPGTLARVAGELAKRQVNIIGFNLANAHDYGALRLIVDDPTTAVHLLSEYNMFVLEHDILAVQLKNEIGGLQRLAAALHKSDIDIEYAYGSTDESAPGATTMYVRVTDPKAAMQVLSKVAGVG